MQSDFDYKVLVNEEGQYSIWPEMKAAPLGWKEVGPTGPKEDVLEWVKTVWTDMRPVSLRGTLGR
jgi:MbtH protein